MPIPPDEQFISYTTCWCFPRTLRFKDSEIDDMEAKTANALCDCRVFCSGWCDDEPNAYVYFHIKHTSRPTSIIFMKRERAVRLLRAYARRRDERGAAARIAARATAATATAVVGGGGSGGAPGQVTPIERVAEN